MLEPIYEQTFLDCSFGFGEICRRGARPARRLERRSQRRARGMLCWLVQTARRRSNCQSEGGIVRAGSRRYRREHSLMALLRGVEPTDLLSTDQLLKLLMGWCAGEQIT